MASVTISRLYADGDPSNLSATNYDADRTEIVTGVNDITNAQINASAAIAASKLSGVVTTTTAQAISGIKTHSAAVNITIANTVNDVALEVTQNDVTNNPNAATITNTGTGNGLYINQDGNGIALNVDNAGTNNGVFINQDGAGTALNIDYDGAGVVNAVTITSNSTHQALDVNVEGVIADDNVGFVVSSTAVQTNVAGGGVASLAKFDLSSTSSTIKLLTLKNAGTGNGLFIDQNGNGVALNIDSEVADDGLAVDIAVAGTSPQNFSVYRVDDVTGNVVLRLGSGYLWVDATGDLRVHTALPTGDTVGTIIGTQA